MEIALATSNPHKIKETAEILIPKGITPILPKQFLEVVEDGDTFEANAIIKAIANAKLNNCYCVGEDSGLEVDSLGGMPGIFSARYSEMDGVPVAREERDVRNNLKLLETMSGHTDRNGRYVCALALANPKGEIIFVDRGECLLTVGFECRIGNGFGYDYVCSSVEFPGRHYSELTAEEKNMISHRSRAWDKLIGFLQTSRLQLLS